MIASSRIKLHARAPRLQAPPAGWTATRALGIDLAWAHQHLAGVRQAIVHHDLPLARTHSAALGGVLTAHMLWEVDWSEVDASLLPVGRRDGLEWSLRTWHGALHRALADLEKHLAIPSLEIPSDHLALEQSIDGLFDLLERYEQEVTVTGYRALDEGVRAAATARAAAVYAGWRDRMGRALI